MDDYNDIQAQLIDDEAVYRIRARNKNVLEKNEENFKTIEYVKKIENEHNKSIFDEATIRDSIASLNLKTNENKSEMKKQKKNEKDRLDIEDYKTTKYKKEKNKKTIFRTKNKYKKSEDKKIKQNPENDISGYDNLNKKLNSIHYENENILDSLVEKKINKDGKE
jgi:hypothetical protein